MSHYTMLAIYGRCTRQFKIGSKLRFFFVKDGMVPEANRFNSFLRILENAISSGKTNKQTKKATRACLTVYLKTHENTWN